MTFRHGYLLSLVLWLGSVAPGAADPPKGKEMRARSLFEEGLAAYEAGRFHEASEKLVEAHRLTSAPELAFNVGRVFERMGEAEKAVRYFRLYEKDLPAESPERIELARRIRDLEALAQRQRDQVFTAPPSDSERTAEARAFFLRGVAMFKRKNFEAALQAFVAAFRFAPIPEVAYNVAITAERLGRTPEAIEFYREYLKLRPTAPDREALERHVAALRGRDGR